MTPTENDHQAIQDLIRENQRILAENNELLKKINRTNRITFWIRIIWILFIIGLPFVIYFYVIEPYFDALGSSFATFQAGLQEIPGWKQFWSALQGDSIGSGE
jgi:Trk-type K+ transport system membrane component